MPPLHKTTTGQSYSTEEDQILLWISKQHGIMNMVFDKMRGAGLVVYDKESGTWRGRDYDA